MSESIEVSGVVPAAPERVYNAWLSADEHAKMIGNSAIFGDDGSFTIWDGYITGRTLEQEPNSRLVQAWRTNEFPEGSPDSRLEIHFEPEGEGTKITFRHSEIPDTQGQSYQEGWVKHYLTPMTEYFNSAGSRLRGAGESVSEAVEKVGEAGDAVTEVMSEAVEEVKKTAQKAAKSIRKLVDSAKKSATRSVKTVQKRAKAVATSARKKLPGAKKKSAPKKAAKAARSARKTVKKVARKVIRKAAKAVRKPARGAKKKR